MGVYLCEGKGVYDVEDSSQGAVFLCLATAYFIFEIYYLWQTVLIFKREKAIHKAPSLILFYTSMHLLIIRSCLYSLGGVLICYPDVVYAILSQYFYIFKRFVFFIIIYRITATHRQLNQLTDRITKTEYTILFMGGIDFVTYSIIYALVVNGLVYDLVLRIYSMVIDLGLMMMFVYFMHSLMRKMAEVLRFIEAESEIYQWYAFIVIMTASFFVRAVHTVFIMLYKNSQDTFTGEVALSVYYAIYLILTEIVPCLVMIWIVSNSNNSKQNYLEKRETITATLSQSRDNTDSSNAVQ